MTDEKLGWSEGKTQLFASTVLVFFASLGIIQFAGFPFWFDLPLAIGLSALNVLMAARAVRWCEALSAWGFPLAHEKWSQARRFLCGATWFFQLPFWAVGASFNRMVTTLFDDDIGSGGA